MRNDPTPKPPATRAARPAGVTARPRSGASRACARTAPSPSSRDPEARQAAGDGLDAAHQEVGAGQRVPHVADAEILAPDRGMQAAGDVDAALGDARDQRGVDARGETQCRQRAARRSARAWAPGGGPSADHAARKARAPRSWSAKRASIPSARISVETDGQGEDQVRRRRGEVGGLARLVRLHDREPRVPVLRQRRRRLARVAGRERALARDEEREPRRAGRWPFATRSDKRRRPRPPSRTAPPRSRTRRRRSKAPRARARASPAGADRSVRRSRYRRESRTAP